MPHEPLVGDGVAPVMGAGDGALVGAGDGAWVRAAAAVIGGRGSRQHGGKVLDTRGTLQLVVQLGLPLVSCSTCPAASTSDGAGCVGVEPGLVDGVKNHASFANMDPVNDLRVPYPMPDEPSVGDGVATVTGAGDGALVVVGDGAIVGAAATVISASGYRYHQCSGKFRT